MEEDNSSQKRMAGITPYRAVVVRRIEVVMIDKAATCFRWKCENIPFFGILLVFL